MDIIRNEIDFETHCPNCKAEYRNIGHPLKPGVIMTRECDCVIVTETIKVGDNVVVNQRLVPPSRTEPPKSE